MTESDNDEFFIGWRANQPAGMRSVVRYSVIGLLFAVVMLAGVLALSQRAPDLSAYEWSNIQSFEGILKKAPYPHLLVEREPGGDFSAYALVAPTKFGISPEWCGELDGRPVRFDGGLIFRAAGTMIEVVSDAPLPVEDVFFRLPVGGAVDLGARSLVGEIVDAKCYFGAMNPGRYKAHRACATVCVTGGVPPMLVVNGPGGATAVFLIVGTEGEMINEKLLPFLARPVRVSGRVTRTGDLWVLAVDPAKIEPM